MTKWWRGGAENAKSSGRAQTVTTGARDQGDAAVPRGEKRGHTLATESAEGQDQLAVPRDVKAAKTPDTNSAEHPEKQPQNGKRAKHQVSAPEKGLVSANGEPENADISGAGNDGAQALRGDTKASCIGEALQNKDADQSGRDALPSYEFRLECCKLLIELDESTDTAIEVWQIPMSDVYSSVIRVVLLQSLEVCNVMLGKCASRGIICSVAVLLACRCWRLS
jgi:hypothetical protein